MKKLLMILLLCAVLAGCSPKEAYETVSDAVVEPTQAKQMQIVFSIPEDATRQVMEGEDTAQVYFCEDYTLTTQVVESGDLQKTIQETTGFLPEQLSVIQLQQDDAKRYSFVWTAATDTGNQVCRCALLDDGNYHYILTAMADESKAGTLSREVWQEIFRSFRLMAPEDVVSSGS